MRQMLCLLVLLIAPRVALAHDVWLTLQGEAGSCRVIINYGHPDDRPPAFVDKVVDLKAMDATATLSLRDGLVSQQQNGVVIAASKPFVDSGHLLLAARYDNGLWTKTHDGETLNVTRRMLGGAGESLWSGKFAKAVSGPGAPFSRVLGHDLELVPLSDPALAKPGDTLKVRVLFRGQPLRGAEVERGDGVAVVAEANIPRFVTDAEGIASVPLVHADATLLVVDHRVSPSAMPDQADADLFNATLWFRGSN